VRLDARCYCRISIGAHRYQLFFCSSA
jgi:hypothetical protein